MTESEPAFRRILLKLSGEALLGEQAFGIDPAIVRQIASEIAALRSCGVDLGLVIGGGNIFRGVSAVAGAGVDRVTGDHLGMLATVMNALAFAAALEELGVPARVLSAIEMPKVCEPCEQRRALAHLEAGRVVIFAGGTGNPFFTTDTAAALRALEIGADLLAKATKVDGVYDRDPQGDATARLVPEISYRQVLAERLRVMDLAAISLCMDNRLPIVVFNLLEQGNILALARGERVGSIVKE